MIQAVLFDVGGPINTEIEHERLIDADILAAVEAAGLTASAEQYAAAVAFAVHSYAPDAHPAIIWHLVQGDAACAASVFADFRRRVGGRNVFELRSGIRDVIDWLRGSRMQLGLAANQPSSALKVLDEHGIGQYFHHRELSGTHGYRKPDPRLSLRACEDLDVRPAACVMIGDRIDNDIAPAKQLGMKTIRFRTGRHIAQQPRSHDEVPDAEVRDASELRAVLESLLKP